MANPKIRAKRSSVEGKVPSTTQLERGEFAVNTYDGKVYVLKDQYSVGIATTTVNVNPWAEPNGIGAGVSYSGSVTATSFAGDGSALTNLNVAGVTTFSGNYNHLFNKPTIPTNNNQLTNGAGYITASSVPTNNNQLTNGAGYITASSVPTNNNQLTNGAGYITASSVPTNNNQLTNGQGFITGYTVTSSDVTQHEGDITITESQISDLGTYLTSSDLSSYATQSYVNTQVSNLVDSAPGTLDTLNELAAALGDDANFSTTVTDSIATKMPLAGGTFTGAVTFASGQTFDYNNLTNTPTIPSNNNQLTNGAGFITNSVSGDLTLTDTATDNSAGPEFVLYRNSSSPSSADYIGQIKFQGESTSGATRLYAKITGKIGDPTNGSEDGIIEIAHRKNGSNNISGRWNQDELQLLNGTELSLGDSQKIKVGTGDDLEIYHDGSNSRIDNNLGHLIIKNLADDQNVTLSTDNGSGSTTTYVQCDGSEGKVKLYYYGSEKLQTRSDGVLVTGELQSSSLDVDGDVDFDGGAINFNSSANTLDFADSVKALFGTGSDFAIYHDGSNSVIETGTSSTGDLQIIARGTNHDLYLQAADDIFIRPQGGESGIVVRGNGAAELYYDNNKKLETSSSGITVTGTVAATSFSGDGSNLTGISVGGASGTDYNDDVKVRFGDSNDLEVYHDGSHSYLKDNGTGNLKLVSNGTAVQIEKSNGENMAIFRTDSSVDLYYDNSKKFETTSSGATVTGTLTATSFSGDGSSLTGISASNADTVDNLHASQFLRSDANDTATGSITFTNDNGIYIKPTTNGTGAKIHFSDHSGGSYGQIGTIQYKHSDGTVTTTGGNSNDGWIVSGTETRTVFKVEGDIEATSDIYSSSDISLKDNVVTYENALDKVLAMRGVEYDRNDLDGKHEVGLIAQEVEEIIPELVGEHHGLKNIAYGKLTAVLIEAIKEQQQQINDLRQQLNKGK